MDTVSLKYKGSWREFVPAPHARCEYPCKLGWFIEQYNFFLKEVNKMSYDHPEYAKNMKYIKEYHKKLMYFVYNGFLVEKKGELK